MVEYQDSIVFEWYETENWAFFAVVVGEEVNNVILDASVNCFQLEYQGKGYEFHKTRPTADGREFKYQCFDFGNGSSRCFFISSGGIYPTIPEENTTDLRFTFYLR